MLLLGYGFPCALNAARKVLFAHDQLFETAVKCADFIAIGCGFEGLPQGFHVGIILGHLGQERSQKAQFLAFVILRHENLFLLSVQIGHPRSHVLFQDARESELPLNCTNGELPAQFGPPDESHLVGWRQFNDTLIAVGRIFGKVMLVHLSAVGVEGIVSFLPGLETTDLLQGKEGGYKDRACWWATAAA